MINVCYNCGIELTNGNSTVEHIPAKNLYEGFGEEYKTNRITVPACFVCNNMYSKIDQEIRDALAINNDNLEQKKVFTGKGVRSILRRPNWFDRSHFNHKRQVIAVDFSYCELKQLHIKNFKALFFRKYAFPVPKNFEIEIIAEGDDDKIDTAQIIYEYLCTDKDFDYSGHPDIFKFIIKDVTPNIEKDNIYESMDFDKLVAVFGLLVYHDTLGALVVAAKKHFIEECKIKNVSTLRSK